MLPRSFYISPLQSDLLDVFRWLAAFLVVIEHLRSLMFADYGTQGGMGVVGRIFYFLTGFGHSAVMVFFVMSGFLVGGKVLQRLAEGNFSWQKYGVDRFSRLYAVYLLALLLGGAFDYFGYHHFNQFGLYDQTFPGQIAVINHNFHQNLSTPVFAINLAMCQTILGPVFGSNGPLWSLANEFWYYLAAPILFLLFCQKKIGVLGLAFKGNTDDVRSSVAIAVVQQLLAEGAEVRAYDRDRPRSAEPALAAALAGIVWFLPSSILIYSVVWLLGAALYFFNERRLLPLWFSLGLFAACFSAARMQCISVPFVADFLIAISFALVINSAAGFSRQLVGKNLSRSLVFGLSLPFSVFSAGAFNLISNWCHWLSRPADVAAGGDFFGRFIGRLSVVLFYLIGDRASDAAHPGMAEPVFYACRT